MSQAMRGSDRTLLQEENVGLQLLYDSDQARSSATIYLQWCIVKQIQDFLREQDARNPLLFVSVKDSKGRETRYLFDLDSEQELIQFRSPGQHTISAQIIWGVKSRLAKGLLLDGDEFDGGTAYTMNLLWLLGEGKSGRNIPAKKQRATAIGMKRFGNAVLTIDVPAEFFAPELSSSEKWWLGLMWQGKIKHSCSIRRRRIFAYALQPVIILPWIGIKMFWRLVIAFTMGILLATRCNWGAIFRPFANDYKDVWEDHPGHFSWIAWKADGTERWYGDISILLTPMIHVVISVIALCIVTGNQWNLTLGNFELAYLIVIAAIACIVGFFVGCMTLSDRRDEVVEWFVSFFLSDKLTKLDKLLCTRSPMNRMREVSYTPRLIYQRLKAAVCKPVSA